MTRLAAIVRALGGTLYAGGVRALIPGPGHSPADRSVSLALGRDGRLLVHCFSPRDDWRTVRAWLEQRFPVETQTLSQPTPPTTRAERMARARRLWSEAGPIAGTAAERYLRGGAILRAAPGPEALRLHAALSSIAHFNKSVLAVLF